MDYYVTSAYVGSRSRKGELSEVGTWAKYREVQRIGVNDVVIMGGRSSALSRTCEHERYKRLRMILEPSTINIIYHIKLTILSLSTMSDTTAEHPQHLDFTPTLKKLARVIQDVSKARFESSITYALIQTHGISMTDITLQNCLNISKTLITAINTYITCPLRTCAASAITNRRTAFLVPMASVGDLDVAIVKNPVVETRFEKTIRLLAKIEIQEAQCLAYLEGEFVVKGRIVFGFYGWVRRYRI